MQLHLISFNPFKDNIIFNDRTMNIYIHTYVCICLSL